jgi:23S rRNA pseudouridine1911/1915/1917 synthase
VSDLRRETLLVAPEAVGSRLDLYLVQALAGVSRKSVKKALDGGQVFVGGRCERRAGMVLAGGETIVVTVEAAAPSPAPPPLTILYRDRDLLAIDKPAGLPAHPTVAGRANALEMVSALLLSEGHLTPPILLHRLDADTTGVLLFALTAAANRALYRQFVEHAIAKVYLALVAGAPPESFTISNHLKAGVRGRTVAVASGGQPAETAFRTLQKLSPPLLKEGERGFALVEARPKTGRTHQIRAHLAGAGYPLLGDALYGNTAAIDIAGCRRLPSRHLLHAFRLSFQHPATQQTVTIEAPLPADFNLPGMILPLR